MIKRILVGLAGTPYTQIAIQQAVELARAHQAEVTGVTIVDMQHLTSVGPAPIGAEDAGLDLRQHRVRVTSDHVDEVIGRFESACNDAGVPYRVCREEGNAFKLMLYHSRYHDLTVFGLRSIFEYYFEKEESTTLLGRLIGEGVRPILAVAREYRPARRVMVAYSGSRASAKTLRQFLQLRPWADLTMRIVAFGQTDEDPNVLLGNAAEYCRAHGIDPEVAHIPKAAREQILESAAEWQADLIVLGNSRASFLVRKLFGETSLHVMQNADRPLFLSQ